MKDTNTNQTKKETQMEKKAIEPINKDQVLSVYSGEANACCCGCKGKHSYRESAIARAVASKKRGYPIDDNEVSERSVSFVVNKINANLGDAENYESFWSFETPTRLYIAYKVEQGA